MKRWLLSFGLVAALGSQAVAVEWLTDLPTALERAKQDKKAVLLDFTGSDWCPWCQKLKAEVFDQGAFGDYAADHLVLVEVDFPRGKALTTEQRDANRALATKYGIRGFPTIIVLDADGHLLGQDGYRSGGPAPYVAGLEKLRARAHREEASATIPETSTSRPKAKAGPVILVEPPPIQYGELTLKGVSGAGSHRMALINNQSLMPGESAKVKTSGTSVEVTVKEIRDNSVVIVVQGQTRELKLAHASGSR